ncbi:hypothetical protein ACPV4I_18375 [Photobacterium damselae]
MSYLIYTVSHPKHGNTINDEEDNPTISSVFRHSSDHDFYNVNHE